MGPSRCAFALISAHALRSHLFLLSLVCSSGVFLSASQPLPARLGVGEGGQGGKERGVLGAQSRREGGTQVGFTKGTWDNAEDSVKSRSKVFRPPPPAPGPSPTQGAHSTGAINKAHSPSEVLRCEGCPRSSHREGTRERPLGLSVRTQN